MKKYFIAASLAVAGLALSVAFILPKDSPAVEKPINPEWLDQSISPGDDFFEHVNAKWLAANPIPATESRWGVFNILDDNSKKMIRQIMEEDAKMNSPEGTIAQKVGDFWYSGMDSVSIEKQGIAPLKPYINRINAMQNNNEVVMMAGSMQKIAATALFQMYVDADQKNSTINILNLYQGGMGLPDRDYYFRTDARSEKIRQGYLEYISRINVLLGSSPEDASRAAQTIMKIETEMAKAAMTRVEQRDPYATYHKMTVGELTARHPNLNWKMYLGSMGFPAMQEVVVAQPKFFDRINGLLDSVKVEDWKLYLRFHFISNASNLISADYEKANFDFYSKSLQGIEEMDPRWKRVSDIANFTLGEALGQEYVKRTFTPEAKQKMVALVNNLKIAFAQRIDQLDWMSPETKVKAKDKLSTIMVKVGYPDQWKDYSSLKIDRGPYVLNVFRCVEFEMNRMIAKAGKPVDRTEWGMSPQTVNAYYNPTNNEIVFPAAILQPPFFDVKADDAVNYGGIGAVIGHEITHGFDDQGRLYDKNGNLEEWWTKEDNERFNAKAERVSKFYSMYNPIDTLRINGDLTNGENIADQGGLAIAYSAFLLEQKKNPQPKKIDGLTADERFFINYAQIWRGKYRDESLRLQLLTNVHSPGKYRVLGTLSNTNEWYSTFHVKPEHKMYVKPEERTHIW
jgi:putative endopeptidase